MRILVLAVALSTAAAASGVAAQDADDPMALARMLYEQGIQHARTGDWEQALGAFERSLAFSERPSTLMNLASAQANTGRLVGSARSYRRYLEIGDGVVGPDRLARARRALSTLDSRIPRVRVRAVGAITGDRIAVDGEVVEAEIGDRVQVDPGAHRIAIVQGDREIATRSIELGEGEEREIEIVARAPGSPRAVAERATPGQAGRRSSPAIPTPVQTPDDDDEESSEGGGSLFESPWFWIVAAVVVAGAGVTTVVLLGEDGTSGNVPPGRIPVR